MQYEWNARTQVTMWYDNTRTNQSKLHDYGNTKKFCCSVVMINCSTLTNFSCNFVFHLLQCMVQSANKFWSGLLKDYYLPRASTYFSYLLRSLQENKYFQLEEWRKEWISYSNKWQAGDGLYAVSAVGDAFGISKSLFEKYLS